MQSVFYRQASPVITITAKKITGISYFRRINHNGNGNNAYNLGNYYNPYTTNYSRILHIISDIQPQQQQRYSPNFPSNSFHQIRPNTFRYSTYYKNLRRYRLKSPCFCLNAIRKLMRYTKAIVVYRRFSPRQNISLLLLFYIVGIIYASASYCKNYSYIILLSVSLLDIVLPVLFFLPLVSLSAWDLSTELHCSSASISKQGGDLFGPFLFPDSCRYHILVSFDLCPVAV